jgi:DNA-binding beta-propeller fold protein YncE
VRFAYLFFLLLTACAADLPPDARWPDRTAPIVGSGPLGYVTNDGEDTVSVIELTTFREIARRPVGLDPVSPEAPHHLAVDPVSGFVWVGLAENAFAAGGGLHGSHGAGVLPSYVQRLDIHDLVADAFVHVDPNLGDIVLGASDHVITTHFDLSTALAVAAMGAPVEQGYGALYVLDGVSMQPLSRIDVCTAPHGAAITHDGNLALIACYGDDAVAFVDLSVTPPNVLARVPVGPMPGNVAAVRYGPYAIAFSPDESFAFVGVLDGTAVRRIDVHARTEVTADAVVLDGKAFFGAFDPTGARYWVPTQARDSLTRIDVAMAVADLRHPFLPADCLSPHEADYVASLHRVFVVCEGDHTTPGSIVSLDPDTLAMIDRIEVGVYPDVMRVVEAP